MSDDPLAQISTRQTPQDEQADPRQRKNRAGGYSFVQDDFARLHRFLTLGTTGGTYYASEHELTRENAGLMIELATKRAAEVVAAVLDISLAGRAPKQNPALFALAAAAKLGDDDGRRAALAAVPLVARTGTHLFVFAGYLQQFGGWGRGTRRAIGNWYVDPERGVDSIAYQGAEVPSARGLVARGPAAAVAPEDDRAGTTGAVRLDPRSPGRPYRAAAAGSPA
jgi:60 kDa SS-A/Ro ribonucleoprotein